MDYVVGGLKVKVTVVVFIYSLNASSVDQIYSNLVEVLPVILDEVFQLFYCKVGKL